jgi:hypothetical protein
MKNMFTVIVMLLISMGISHAVYTKYLSDLKFDNIELYSFSNVSFIENGGLEISRAYKEIFSSQYPVWSLAVVKDGLIAGTGDPARLIYINKEGSKSVYEASNDVLISDIENFNGLLYLSSFPRAKLTVLDENFKLKKRIQLNNEYVWNIIPDGKGYFVLTGNPAVLYHFNEKDESDYNITMPGEDNLLRGVIAGSDLYFSADGNVLYKIEAANKKARAVFSFDNPIMDMIYYDHKIHVITSVLEAKKTSQVQSAESSSSEDDSSSPVKQTGEKPRPFSGKSALYTYDLSGSIEKVYEKSGIRFIALSYWNDSIVIGTDKNAGYYQISLLGNMKRFSGFGKGKFARFFNLKGENYAMLLEPGRIIKISRDYAPSGIFLSGVFDTGNISFWGKPFTGSVIYPETGMKIYSRSGAVADDNLWEDWVPFDGKINSSPNRFFQYKIELTSAGTKSPEFTSMVIPFVQKNSAPRVEKITLTYNNGIYKISWDAVDDDKDILIYDIYLSISNSVWVKINEKPLEDNTFDLNTGNYPDGQYRIKITASDERSNPPSEAKEGYRISEPFMIDNTPPQIGDITVKRVPGAAELSWQVKDALSPLLEVDYSLNGLKWIKLLPDSGMYDSPMGSFSLKLAGDVPCFLEIKAVNIYGNYSTRGLYINK